MKRFALLLFALAAPVMAQIQIGSGGAVTVGSLGLPLTGGTLTGPLIGTSGTFSGNFTVGSLNNTIYADRMTGATADAKINAACAALPSTGGMIDATGFGATTQSWASTVSCGSASKPVTIIFDPATLFQASSSNLGLFTLEPTNHISGFTFDCGNQPSYTGTIFHNDTSVVYGSTASNGDRTFIQDSGTSPNCNAVTGGTFLNLTSTALSTGVYFVSAKGLRIKGLANGIYMQASGMGFVNGNSFIDVMCTATKACWTANAVGGSIDGNLFTNFSHEELPGTGTRAITWQSDGSANSTIRFNNVSGNSWDTSTWGTLSASASVMNSNRIELFATGACTGTCGFAAADTSYNTIINRAFAATVSAYSLGSYGGFWFLSHSNNGLRLAAPDLNKTMHLFLNSSAQAQVDVVGVGTGMEVDANGAGTVIAGTGAGVFLGANLYNGSGFFNSIPSAPGAGYSLVNATAKHGTATQVQMSDGTGTTSNCAMYAADKSLTDSGTPCAIPIANVQITTGVGAVAATTCTSPTATTMTGVATTSAVISPTPTTDTSAVTGWGSSGGLVFTYWVTANTFNWRVCNPTASSITPGGSVTWNVGAR